MITQPLEDLLREPTYWTTQIQLDLFRAIDGYLKENNLKRKDLAEKLGVSKGYISQILNGNFDHKLSKLVELLLAIEKVPDLRFLDLKEAMRREKREYAPIKKAYSSGVQQVTITTNKITTQQTAKYGNSDLEWERAA